MELIDDGPSHGAHGHADAKRSNGEIEKPSDRRRIRGCGREPLMERRRKLTCPEEYGRTGHEVGDEGAEVVVRDAEQTDESSRRPGKSASGRARGRTGSQEITDAEEKPLAPCARGGV